MPVYKDVKRGSWYVKCQVKDPVTNATKQVLKRGFKTKTEAKDWEAEQRTSGSNSTGITFRQVMDRYYAYNAPKERTEEHQRRMVERYFPMIDQPVNAITRPVVMDWYLRTCQLDLKPGTINLLLAVVKSVFKYGADFYELPNPAAGLKRVKNVQRKYETWTPEEFRQFLESVDNDMYRTVFMFIYWTGCRKSEALGLRRGDFKGRTVHICRNLKTESSDRVLTLPEALNEALRPAIDRLQSDDDLLFPIAPVTLQQRFRKYVEKAGVKPIRIHDLRHSFATNLINSGANIVAVSKYLGHANINQTLKTYTHLLRSTDEKLVQSVNDMMKNG